MADAVAVHNQGGALIERYQRTGDHRLLDEGVSVLREALRIGGLTETISTLASALVHRYEHSADPADLDEAMALLNRLVDGPGVNLTQATEIVRVQRHRYELGGDTTHLDQAIALAQGCIAQTDARQPDYDLMQHLLGLALAERYERTRTLADLEAAIAAHRMAADVSTDERRPGMLLNLAATLHARIAATGDLSVLEEAEAMVGGALAELPRDHPERNSAEWLAGALTRYRGQLTGDTDVLRSGIDALRRSVTSATGPEALTARLDSLGTALMHQFESTGDQAALSEAIEVMRQSAEHAEAPSSHLNNLGNALWLRYQRLGDLAALWEAVEIFREAVAAGLDPRSRGIALSSLVTALTDLGKHSPDAVEEAVTAARDLVSATESADAREKLAHALLTRFEVDESRDDLIEAGELFEEVLRRRPSGDPLHAQALGGLGGFWRLVHERTGTPETLNEAITCYGRAARGEQRGPQRATYQYAFAELLKRQAEETGDGGRIRAASRAYAEAAGSEALDSQTRVLAAGSWSAAAARAGDWTEALRGAEQSMALIPTLAAPELTAVVADAVACACQAAQPALAVRWLEQGRAALLGQEFKPDEDHPDATVVLINVSELRCDALVVRPHSVKIVPLPLLTRDEATARLARLGSALPEVLEWLRETVTDPVLDQLGGETRVWWSPGGPLATMPVHAAAVDRVISSYTPTVRALSWAFERVAAPPADPSMLVVAMPLPHAHEEVEALAELWEAAQLTGAQATRENVLAGLRRHPYVHFACHGVGDRARSRLLLHDGPLTVLDIARLRLPSARLAVLSSCDVAGAFQVAGYPSVVGTLWQLDEDAAATAAVAFHSALLDHGLDESAAALHEVVLELRAKYPPSVWAAYVHIGV